ncbi:MAG: hypothetical protein QG656_526 [Candidatus Hydrogenedentes bacterium]|nr:hypothetical protein [Candidatus Hydrogenedentota bacterium]
MGEPHNKGEQDSRTRKPTGYWVAIACFAVVLLFTFGMREHTILLAFGLVIFCGIVRIWQSPWLKMEPFGRTFHVKPAICLIMALALALAVFSALQPLIREARELRDSSSSDATNLKMCSQIVTFYANRNDGRTPPLSDVPGRLMFTESVYPKYMTDCRILVHRHTPDTLEPATNDIDDTTYIYLSHLLLSEKEGLTYVKAYREHVAQGQSFDEDFTVPVGEGNEGSNVLRRIDLDELPALDTDAGRELWSIVPVMVERPAYPYPPHGNVLYLDGHVEYIELGAKFPMTETFIHALESLDDLEPRR